MNTNDHDVGKSNVTGLQTKSVLASKPLLRVACDVPVDLALTSH